MPKLPEPAAAAAVIPEWAAVEPELADLLAAGVTRVHALARWGMQLLEQNRIADAVTVFRAAVALEPEQSTFWTNYGVALDRANDLDEAAACLEHSLALARNQTETWLLLGLVRRKQGKPAAAEAAYLVALEQEPGSTVLLRCLGMLKEEQKDPAAALGYFAACVEHGDASAPVLTSLGRAYYQLGRFLLAYEAYERAQQVDGANLQHREMLRKTRFLRDALEVEPFDEIIGRYQQSFVPPEEYAEHDLIEMFNTAFTSLAGYGHVEAAIRVGHKQLELWPENPSVAYLLKALTGDTQLTRAAPEYIVARFDAFAEKFDTQLVEVLGYNVPEQIGLAVEAASPGIVYDEALDIGCGTGLCGRRLRGSVRRLAGVDLSSEMLKQAAKRGIYDQLERDDIITFLDRSHHNFDLIVGADVIIYLGDLVPLFAGAARALRPGGLFVFSTESLSDQGFRLQLSGRFAHSAEYVRQTARLGFEEQSHTETTIRTEGTRPVVGDVFVFRRRTNARAPSLQPKSSAPGK